MAIRAENLARIRARGAWLCGSDEFCFVRCPACGRFVLSENETGRLFFDPADLSRFRFAFDTDLACPGCGRHDAGFVETTPADLAALRASEWGPLLAPPAPGGPL